MTFRLRHEWVAGAVIVSALLSTCPHCETLRVEERDEIPFRRDRVHFIRRAIDPSSPPDRRTNLILEDAPPCIAPAGFFRAPEDGAASSVSPPAQGEVVVVVVVEPPEDAQRTLW